MWKTWFLETFAAIKDRNLIDFSSKIRIISQMVRLTFISFQIYEWIVHNFHYKQSETKSSVIFSIFFGRGEGRLDPPIVNKKYVIMDKLLKFYKKWNKPTRLENFSRNITNQNWGKLVRIFYLYAFTFLYPWETYLEIGNSISQIELLNSVFRRKLIK